MKRLNPETGNPFKCGYVREDGKIFRGYNAPSKLNKNGYRYEIWETESVFYKRQTARKVQSREHRASPEGRAYHMIANCKGSSKRRNIHFDLKAEDIAPAVESGHCQLTGLPFDFNPPKGKGFNPYAPSVDRIDNNKGYVAGNVRVVLWAVNSALSESSDEEMLPILKAMVKAIEKNVKTKSIAPVSEGDYIYGAVGAEIGSISTPWTWEDYDHSDDHSGAVRGQDADHSTQASSGDSVGHGGQEVGALEPLTRIEDYGQPDAEIVRLEFGRRYLSDKP
jgi:hypothetical protein